MRTAPVFLTAQEVAELAGADPDPRCVAGCGAEVTRPGRECPSCRERD